MADDNNDVQVDKDDIVIDKDEAIESDKTPSIDFTIEVLPFIKEAQNQHGLKHGDYQRYRLYCSRRLRRIRKSLHFTHGHRNRYHKRPITAAVITDVRYLYILLISAERAWSAAMELKQVGHMTIM
jgi:signal recognition particle subunit SRP68